MRFFDYDKIMDYYKVKFSSYKIALEETVEVVYQVIK